MIILSSESIAFGELSKGNITSSQVAIYNTDTVSVDITSIVSSSPDFAVGPTVFTIDANDSLVITINCIANTATSGIITISNTAGPDKIINLTVIILEPIVDFDVSDIAFNDVGINDTVTVTRTISNIATNNSVLNVSFASTNSNFLVEPASLQINCGESKDVSISIHPTTIGSKNGTIDVIMNDSIGNYSINVSGTAVLPSYDTSTSSIDFQQVAINNEASLSFDITNTHTSASLIISSITLNSSDLSITPATVIIVAQQVKTFIVIFKPLSSLPLSGDIVLHTNAGDINIVCLGEGIIVPLLKSSMTTIDYDIYSLNVDKSIKLTLSNIGLIDAYITTIDLPSISDTTITVSVASPFIIKHGQFVDITFTINSLTEVSFSDAIVIHSNAYNDPVSLLITGEAKSPVISIDTDSLDFGTISAGTSKLLSFKISNNGDVDLHVSIVNSVHFSVQSSSFIVRSQQISIVDVTFSINTEGDIVESLEILSNDISQSSISLLVSGSANFNQSFRVIPEKIIKYYISKDVDSQISLQIFNSSTLLATINSMTDEKLSSITTQYDITTNSLPISLIPGDTTTILLTAKATTTGLIGGVLKFDIIVGTSHISVVVEYSGEVFAPAIECQPASLDFGDVAIGDFDYQILNVKNSNWFSDLKLELSVDNSIFYFKGTKSETLIVNNNKINLSNKDVVLQTVQIVIDLTGEVLILGDPTIYADRFSVDTSTGEITVNAAISNKSCTIDYEYKLTTLSLTVAGFSNTDISVGCSPEELGLTSGSITIETNDSLNPSIDIPVVVNGQTAIASIELLNPLINFGVKVNDTIFQKAVLKNTGNIKLFVYSVTVSLPFSVKTNRFSIDPQETYQLDIGFSPLNQSNVSQNIVIQSNAPNLIIPVTGTGQLPQMVVPTTIDCGQSGVDIEKDVKVTIQNIGDANLDITLLSVTPNVFRVTPTITTVVANSSYDIHVKFKPVEETTYTGILKILSNDSIQPDVSITVSGEGVKKAVIDVVDVLEFDKTNVSATNNKNLIIKNLGTDPLQITNITITDNVVTFSVIDFVPASIPPNDSKSYVISFVPKTIGALSNTGVVKGALKIENNDEDNINKEVKLKGKAVNPEGEWQAFDLQQMIPDPLLTVANSISDFITPVKTILELVKTIINLAKVLLVDASSALAVILQQIANIITDYVNDLAATGLYILPVMPTADYYDPDLSKDVLASSFGRYLASMSGGSEKFKSRIVDSFDDAFDSRRPQFSDSAQAAAIVIAVDSGNVVDIIKGILALKKIFASIKDDAPEITAPQDLATVNGDSKVTLQWSLPELIPTSLNPVKMWDLIWGFDIYKTEKQQQIMVADKDYYSDQQRTKIISHKGEVIDLDTKEVVQAITVSVRNVLATNFKSNFAPGLKNADTPLKPAIGCEYEDTDVENDKSYFYSIRTRMSPPPSNRPPTDPKSPLSNEVVGRPQAKPELDLSEQILNRCSYLVCKQKNEVIQTSIKLSEPIVKDIDLTSVQQASINKLKASDVKQGIQKINEFTITINDLVNLSTIVIRNPSAVERYVETNSVEINPKLYFNNEIIDWDDNLSSVSVEKNQYFSILNGTKLMLGFDLTIIKDTEKSIIIIRDIGGKQYQANDYVVIEYSGGENMFELKCAKERNEFNKDPDAARRTCALGTTECPEYTNNRCLYSNGKSCSNAGNTWFVDVTGQGYCRKNSSFFNSLGCQNGLVGGTIRYIDKVKRNDPNYCIKVTGNNLCAGYTSLKEFTTGVYPNWTSISLNSLIKPVSDFINEIEKWVNRELQAIQKGSQSVTNFINLLTKKIEALEEFIDLIQVIIDTLLAIFSSNSGFYLLFIDMDTGGSKRIKTLIQSAKNGPSSGADGYTAGVVLMVGGPGDVAKTWEFLKLFFK